MHKSIKDQIIDIGLIIAAGVLVLGLTLTYASIYDIVRNYPIVGVVR